MDGLFDEVDCLSGLGGLEDVRGEALDLGDQGWRITYTRPGSQLTLSVALVFERIGDVVSQVVHLDYPIDDQGLTDELITVSERKLEALSAE
jgi:hypothetical protein